MMGCKREAAAPLPKRGEGKARKTLAVWTGELLAWAEAENVKTVQSRNCMDALQGKGVIR